MRRLQFSNSTTEDTSNDSPVLQKLLDKIRAVEDDHKIKENIQELDNRKVEKSSGSNLWCYAYLSNYEEVDFNGGFSLTVECRTDNVQELTRKQTGVLLVGSNIYPYDVTDGTLKLCLKSSVLEADEKNGEHSQLCKTQIFHGQAFEKQFALKRIQEHSKLKGVLGKFLLQKVTDSGDIINIGDFNLQYSPKKVKASDDEEEKRWLTLGYKELAESIGIFNECSPSTTIFEEFGLTQNEIDCLQASSTSADPFSELVMQFKRRKGTASEFIQKLYRLKRRQNLEPFINGTNCEDFNLTTQLSSSSSATVLVSEETELTEACLLLTPPPTPRKRGINLDGSLAPIKRPKLRLDFHSSLDTIADSDADAETIPADDIEMHVFPPTPRKFDSPLSPPLTPLKRLTSSAREQNRKFFNNNNDDVFVFPDK